MTYTECIRYVIEFVEQRKDVEQATRGGTKERSAIQVRALKKKRMSPKMWNNHNLWNNHTLWNNHNLWNSPKMWNRPQEVEQRNDQQYCYAL